MKAVLCLAIVIGLLISGSAYANLMINPDLMLDADGQINMNGRDLDDVLGWTGSGWSNVVVPTDEGAALPPNGIDLAARISYDHWNHDLYQNTGVIVQPDTVYTISFDAYPLTWVYSIVMEWYAGDEYVGWAREWASPDNSPGWNSHTFTFDSSEYEHAVGQGLGMRFFISSEDQGGGRVMLNNFELIPEPATMVLLGLGSVVLLKRRG